MPKTAELSESTRKSIIQLHRDGSGYRKISSVVISYFDSWWTVWRWKSFYLTTSLPCSGRPTKISLRMARNLVRKARNNPRLNRSELQKDLQSSGTNVCKNTIRTVLRKRGFHSRSPRKTPLLKQIHVNNCLNFAKEHMSKPSSFWDKILWSDETKIELKIKVL